MPPVSMETILRLLDYPNTEQYCRGYPSIYTVCWGATKSLGGVFVERKIRSDNANKLWAMLCKTFFYKQKPIRYGGKLVQNVKTISQEPSFLDHLVSVVEMSYLISIEASTVNNI